MKPKKNIKFKIQYVPLSDERVNAHKDFDALMAAYVVAPKPNIFQRWMNNRSFLFGSGLMVGLTFSAVMFINNVTNDAETVVTNQPKPATQEQVQTKPEPQPEQSNDAVTNPPVNDKATSANNSNEQSIVNAEEKSEVTKPVLSPVEATEKAIVTKATSVSGNDVVNGVESKTESTVQQPNVSAQASNKFEEIVPVSSDENVLVETHKEVEKEVTTVETEAYHESDEEAAIESKSDDIALTEIVVPQELEREIEAIENAQTAIRKSDQPVALVSDSVEQTEMVDDDAMVNANEPTLEQSELNAEENEVSNSETSVAKDDAKKKFVFQDLFAKKEPSLGDKKKSHWLPQHDPTADDGDYTNRYAQVSFVTPLSTNGPEGFKYKHFFSLNVLQGNTGALEGVEIGGLANVTKGYVRGTQFGGILNYAGGSVNGAQFGGVANTSLSLKGAQFGGVANINQRGGWGFQAGGVANVNVLNEKFNGWQVAGAANYSGGDLNGVQLSGAANVAVRKLDGGQISGAVNIANEANGFQIGVVNFARKMKGFQFGVVNIADTMQGGGIGIINLSRNGQFSVDLWSSDYFQVNGGVKMGSNTMYNVFAYGVSPFGNGNLNTDDSLISVSSPLPFGFGFGLGAHLPIKKAFVNIDGMTWTVHDRYFSFAGINMLNQLRVTGGYQFHKYFGVYAGPVANVSLQDNKYKSLREDALYEYNGTTNKLRGWIGFVAGVQLF